MTGNPSNVIKAFSIDLNSDALGQPSAPGLFAHVNAEEHVKWCRDLGANAIQTFCVSLNGYAWYRSKVAPVAPGMNGDFLNEQIELAHRQDMEVHGYFCLAGNAWYQCHNREETSSVDRRKAIPLTAKYVDYFCRMIEEAVRENDLDGILIDWFEEIEPIWIPAEKQLFTEIMGKAFPEKPLVDDRLDLKYDWFGELSAPRYFSEDVILDFRKRATLNAWNRISAVVRKANPACKLWLNVPFHEPEEPMWVDSPILKEVDMMLTERCDTRIADWLDRETGGKPVLVNLGGLGKYSCSSWEEIIDKGYHLFAFCKADPLTTLPDLERAGNLGQVRSAFRDATR